MSYRNRLLSLRLAYALRESFSETPYSAKSFSNDLIAGVTVGIIALPLSMALAIASGVAPQYGLYTAIVAGFLIALTGGSRYSVSGPTAAFVVILFPIAEKFGLGGLLISTLLSGLILITMAFARVGRFIEYIPPSVTLGFTSGIAVVIATLQVKDFFGLTLDYPEAYVDKLNVLAQHLRNFDWPSVFVGSGTLLVLIFWKRLSTFPPHIPALLMGVLLAWLFSWQGDLIDTIGSRFSYTLPDGTTGKGIPPILPTIMWPWEQLDAAGKPIGLSWELLQLLLPAAFSIAILGAIESLLCAVVLDNMTNTHHSANSELLGQGIGNMVAPFFGGITATAAIARSAANLRSGAKTPIASMLHAVVVLLALLLLAPMLAYLPMASMAAMLLIVAWNIAEVDKIERFLRTAPRADTIVLLVCFALTVFIDMVIAIGVGVVLASFMFMREVSTLTRVSDISEQPKFIPTPLPNGWAAYRINGPLFFAAAERIFADLLDMSERKQGVILTWDSVSVLDAGGLAALVKYLELCAHHATEVIITDLQFQPLKTLARSHIEPIEGQLLFTSTLADALEVLESRSINQS